MSPSSRGDRPSENSYWVIPGRFAAGEYPGALKPRQAAVRLNNLFDEGIDYFIDLTQPGELEPYDGVLEDEGRRRGLTVGWERHPIVDMSIPHSLEQMIGILDAIDAALEGGKTVYVHCWGGVGRTGTVVGCWLVRHGRTGEAALARIDEWWQGMEKIWRHPRSPERRIQIEYVRDWVEKKHTTEDAQ